MLNNENFNLTENNPKRVLHLLGLWIQISKFCSTKKLQKSQNKWFHSPEKVKNHMGEFYIFPTVGSGMSNPSHLFHHQWECSKQTCLGSYINTLKGNV